MKKYKIIYLIISGLLFGHFQGNSQTISLGNEAACQNDTINLPISISTPTAVGAITFTIDYDTNSLSFIRFVNIEPALTTNGVSTFNAVNGQARFVWFTIGANASTISDTTMYIQFIGTADGVTNVAWDTITDAKSELADVTGNVLNVVYSSGTANIQSAPANPTLTTLETTICDNETVVFTSSGGATYEFYINGQVAQGQSALTTYMTDSLVNGDTVRVQVFNSIGCSSFATNIIMTVDDLPVGQMTGDTAVCSGQGILLNFTLSIGTFTAKVLRNGSILTVPAISNNAQISITSTDTTDYILQTLTNMVTGCATTGINDTVSVIVYPLPVIDLGNDTAICSDETLTLDAENIGASYLWSDNSTLQTLVVDSTATYEVTVIDANTCVNTDNINVAVNCFTLTGTLNYPNSQSSPIVGAEMTLLDKYNNIINLPSHGTGNFVTTDVNGNYTFTKVPMGLYYVKPTITLPHGGLVQGVDGYLILQYFAKLLTFDNIRFKAADVNADGVINAADGLSIDARAQGLTNFFPAGDWAYEYNLISISNQDFNHLIKAMCYGDLDGSYVP